MKIGGKSILKIVSTLLALCAVPVAAFADDENPTTATNSWTPQNSRFGLFDWLDHRSGYFQDCFPQGLLVEDTSMETEGELELNYSHLAAGQQRSDVLSAELQKSFGLVTFELEVPYERFSDSGVTTKGIGDLELNLRYPLYQYVSGTGFFDTTVGAGAGFGIPVNSAVSKNAELEPGLFDDLKLGNHFTVQTILGFDQLFGGGDDGGSEEFEYGFDFALAMSHDELPIPGVEKILPMFEVAGDLGLNKDESGQNSVLGGIGFRMNLRSIDGLEPTLGLSYLFPLSSAGREEVHWGIASSFTVEF